MSSVFYAVIATFTNHECAVYSDNEKQGFIKLIGRYLRFVIPCISYLKHLVYFFTTSVFHFV